MAKAAVVPWRWPKQLVRGAAENLGMFGFPKLDIYRGRDGRQVLMAYFTKSLAMVPRQPQDCNASRQAL
jgi:hypothetical protein